MTKNTEEHYDLLVCTCDIFEDTWIPFFSLLKKYWPGAENLRIILTTETMDFSFPGLTIICAKTGKNWRDKSRPWGSRILASLDLVEAPLVLWTCDEFFIKRHVLVEELNIFANTMLSNSDWGRLELNPQGVRKGVSWTLDPRLVLIAPLEDYRVNCQTALWRVECLQQVLRPHESPWEFELRGSVRTQKSSWQFARLANGWNHGKDTSIIHPITDDAIRRGSWRREIVEPLFAELGMTFDLSRRGFYEQPATKQSTNHRKGFRKVIRRDLLSIIFSRMERLWSNYRSFR